MKVEVIKISKAIDRFTSVFFYVVRVRYNKNDVIYDYGVYQKEEIANAVKQAIVDGDILLPL